MSLDRSIDQKILRCIDEILDTLGESGRRALQNYFEKDMGLKKESIPEKPELFCRGLSLIFGEQCAEAVEAGIVQKLFSSFELKNKSDLTLAEAIDMIKAAEK